MVGGGGADIIRLEKKKHISQNDVNNQHLQEGAFVLQIGALGVQREKWRTEGRFMTQVFIRGIPSIFFLALYMYIYKGHKYGKIYTRLFFFS